MAGRSHMKITARLSETGRLVGAAVDSDWAEVHCAGERPALYCPDSGSDCRNALIAVEIENKKRGTVTRFFRFARGSRTCGHAAVSAGVTVRAPAEVAEPAVSGESREHVWLKQHVVDIATAARYEAVQEQQLPGGVRADVYVRGAQAARVEVQRGPADIPARTELHPDVVWLLREAHSTSSGNKAALFSSPCVQIRITARRVINGEVKWVAAQPWSDPEWDDAVVSASSTALRLADRDGGAPFFETKPIDLSLFLWQIWSGERRWYPKGQAHESFAGWALVTDVEAFTRWRQELRERQRVANMQARVVVPPRPVAPAVAPPAPPTHVRAADLADTEQRARPASPPPSGSEPKAAVRPRASVSARHEPVRRRGWLLRYLRAFFEG